LSDKKVKNEEDYVKIFSGKRYKIIIKHYCFQSKPEVFMILLGKWSGKVYIDENND